MKALHRPNLFGWSVFDESRNMDFNGVLWVRPGGNVLFDPPPLSPHDEQHLLALGGASLVVLSNSDHVRAARERLQGGGARVLGPRAERDVFPISCDDWIGEGDEPFPGLRVFELEGSKTPGELAFLLDGHTLLTGDLVRAPEGGRLRLLPEPKLMDRARAVLSVKRLAAMVEIEAVLVGDGWPIFRGGHQALLELAESLG